MLPNCITVFGHDISINKMNGPDVGAFGHMKHGTNEIFINENTSPSQQVSTLIHEIIEFINFQLELNLTHPQICGLETGLYQALAGNYLLGNQLMEGIL